MGRREDHPKIIILRGNSGSGKTTIAKDLQVSLGTGSLLLSQDTIRREILAVKDGPMTPTIDLLIHLVRYGYQHATYTILEGILRAEWYQGLFETIQELFKEEIHAYYFSLPFEETLFRHQSKTEVQGFGETELRRWWQAEDYLPMIAESLIKREESRQEILERILSEVSDS